MQELAERVRHVAELLKQQEAKSYGLQRKCWFSLEVTMCFTALRALCLESGRAAKTTPRKAHTPHGLIPSGSTIVPQLCRLKALRHFANSEAGSADSYTRPSGKAKWRCCVIWQGVQVLLFLTCLVFTCCCSFSSPSDAVFFLQMARPRHKSKSHPYKRPCNEVSSSLPCRVKAAADTVIIN